MRCSSAEAQQRWLATQSHSASVADLQRAVGHGGSSSPCLSGCRSVCWKIFLLSQEGAKSSWSEALREGRSHYAEQYSHFLKFITNPEALSQVTIDPLADDPESPWNTIREDQTIRAEILQDVQRLPDEANYHDDHIQLMILDILFVYCKAHPHRGGYRQGMHELLAPIVHVIEEDALDRKLASMDEPLDEDLLETIDAAFIEHDAYILFSRLMEHAQAFYLVKDVAGQPPDGPSSSSRFSEQTSAIVERSKYIHEVCLRKIDPELADHLTNMEILPQIFLIRWIRLIFSREFPFAQFLAFWDIIFAIDPSLDLIDLICCSMLVRIRWQLLESDYSVCLQLLLKYPTPSHPYGPRTFVDDALFLRDHLNSSGGASLIMKYTGKAPKILKSTESFDGASLPFSLLRRRGSDVKSPPMSPTRFLQQQGGVESLFHGVLEKGQKLGINQAVRDAIGEIRRNMQGGLNEVRHQSISQWSALSREQAANTLAVMERRNRRLASYLDESVQHLKAISMPDLEDKAEYLELIELAASKIQFVQILLQDSSMEIPEMTSPIAIKRVVQSIEGGMNATQETERNESTMTAVEEASVADITLAEGNSSPEKTGIAGDKENGDQSSSPSAPPQEDAPKTSPSTTIPARSTIAQSSFSWMLEPDDSSSPKATPVSSTSTLRKSIASEKRKRGVNNSSREKNAFLFGETTPVKVEGSDPLGTGDIFGMEPLPKPKAK